MLECLLTPKLEVYCSRSFSKTGKTPKKKIFASKNSQYTHLDVDDQAKYNPLSRYLHSETVTVS